MVLPQLAAIGALAPLPLRVSSDSDPLYSGKSKRKLVVRP